VTKACKNVIEKNKEGNGKKYRTFSIRTGRI